MAEAQPAAQLQQEEYQDTNAIVNEFAADKVNQENVAGFYNNMSSELYDQLLNDIKFTDPPYIANALIKPHNPEDGADTGFFNADRGAKIYDIGCGNGLLGKTLGRWRGA